MIYHVIPVVIYNLITLCCFLISDMYRGEILVLVSEEFIVGLLVVFI